MNDKFPVDGEKDKKDFDGYSYFLSKHLWWGIGCLFAIMILLTLIVTKSQAAEFSAFGEVLRSSYERPSGSLWQQEFAGYDTYWDTRKTGFRLGAGYGMVRLSYFDLGTYHISGEASDDEEWVVNCSCKVFSDDTDWYDTHGNIRGVALTIRPTWRNLFLELGPIYVRQGFHLVKDDGWVENYTRYGWGTMTGVGVEYKNVSLGIYRYTANIKFPTPTGTGGAIVYTLGVKF